MDSLNFEFESEPAHRQSFKQTIDWFNLGKLVEGDIEREGRVCHERGAGKMWDGEGGGENVEETDIGGKVGACHEE